MTVDPKARTHTAYTRQRLGKKVGPWLEIGGARIDGDEVHVFLDRLTIGGWGGYARLIPCGKPLPTLEPQRPVSAVRGEEEFEG